MDSQRQLLDDIYISYNKLDLVSPDPLQFLYDYKTQSDLEIVGLIASSLAYGRVQQILKAISIVLEIMGESPHDYIKNNEYSDFSRDFDGFKYRFTTGDDIARLCDGLKDIFLEFGSLEVAFMVGYSDEDETLLPATTEFVKRIASKFDDGKTYLLPSPLKGSACKRFNLFLRWMIRDDEVDLGVWDNKLQSKLLIPLDTHMNNICTSVGMTKRKNADLKAVVEITNWFKNINCDDPVKYDFALTRFGIRDDMNIEDLLRSIIK